MLRTCPLDYLWRGDIICGSNGYKDKTSTGHGAMARPLPMDSPLALVRDELARPQS